MTAVDPAAPHVCDACGCVSCFIASDLAPYPQCAAVLALLAERDALRASLRRCVEAHETGRYEPAVVAYEHARAALNTSTGDDA